MLVLNCLFKYANFKAETFFPGRNMCVCRKGERAREYRERIDKRLMSHRSDYTLKILNNNSAKVNGDSLYQL